MTSEIKVDTISEQTSANGVTIDGLTIKDGNIIGDVALAGTTPTFTVGDGGAEDAALIFDGNAVDYYMALDDSADNLIIGSGSTVGSNSLITIDSDGDFTLDSAGDIILDADGADVSFRDGGTGHLSISNSSNDAVITSLQSDNDMIFKGVDGGALVTALTLDMSDAGTASFNHDIKLVDGAVIDCAGDVIFDIDGGDLSFKDGGTSVVNFGLESGNFIMNAVTSDTDMIFKGNDGGSAITALTLDMSAAGNATFNGAIIANAGVSVDNITIDGTEIDLSSGDLTLDVAGDIIFDSDAPNWRFKDNGTSILEIGSISSGPSFYSAVSDADIHFKGNDGGSTITALLLDMSAAGNATFNADVTVGGTLNASSTQIITSNTPIITFIESDQSNKQYQIGSFGSAFAIYDQPNTEFRYTIDTEGNHVFNDGGADCNFKIESDGQARLFFVDGGNNEVQVSNVGTFFDTDRVFSVRQVNNNAGAVHISNAATDNAHAGMMYMSLNIDESTSAGFQLLADSNDNQIFFRGDGNGFFDGAADAGNADFAEYFESTDSSVIDIGKTVVLDNGKVRASTDSDSAADIVGVVRHRKTVGVVGNSAWNKWKGKYKVDDYGVPLTENYSVTKWTETFTEDVKDYKITYNGKVTTFDKEKGDKMEHNYMTDKIPSEVTVPSDATVVDVDADGVKLKRKILNDNYDASKEYVSREFRDEWNLIGLTGQVTMTKGQKTGDRWIKMRDISDTVEEWLVR
jgi:hypothetical protein